MLGESASSPATNTWYVIAQDGDLVLRVRHGMKLGEDPAGELSFHPEDARLELDLAPDGTLILIAGANHQFEMESGETARRVEVPPHSQVQVGLVNTLLRIETDFAEASLPDDRVQIRTIQLASGDTAGEDVILVPEAIDRSFPLPAGTADGFARERARKGSAAAKRRAVFAAAAVGAMVAAGVLYSLAWPQIESRLTAGSVGENVRPTTAPGPAAPSTPPAPDVAQVLASIAGLLSAQPLPDESALNVGVQSLKALLAAYPDDARVRLSLEAMTERLAGEAKRQHDQGDVATSRRLIEMAATTGVGHEQVTSALAHIAASPAVPAPPLPAEESLPVEPVILPAVQRRTMPERPPQPSSPPPEPATERVARTEAPEDTEPRIDWELLGDVQAIVAGQAIERDLEAAAEALERGLLMPPIEGNAFTLYSRVLDQDPDSETAQAGLESVQEALLARARTSLGSDDFTAALAALDDAAQAGANETLIGGLRSEVSYRQRLLAARAGRFGSLYPITRLKAIRQDPPIFPGYAALGTERSVALEMTVDEAGEVRDVEVLGDPPRRFARAARQAVSNWRFEPVLENGKPLPVRTWVRMTFRRE